MKKLFLISSFAVFLLAATYSFASNITIVEPTPIVQDDDTKVKECEKTKTKTECEAKKSECSKDCTASCCKKEEK